MKTQSYEVMLILKNAGTEEDQKALASEIDELIKKIDGVVGRSQHIGRRKLAYEINHQTEGYYYLVRFEAPSSGIHELERAFQLHEQIVRYMVLTADNAPLEEPIFQQEASEAARERATLFAADVIVPRYEAYYRRILAT